MHHVPDHTESLTEAGRRFEDFLRGKSSDRVFYCRLANHTDPVPFCPCHVAGRGFASTILWQLRYVVAACALLLPWNSAKVFLLRMLGAKIGRNVCISPRVWIDPLFPGLLTIEDNVLVGVGARIAMHEFGIDHFRAGRVVIREGANIGGFSLIAPGVEIGKKASVAAAAVAAKDVPAGATVIGNPGRIVKRRVETPSGSDSTCAARG
ncbi:MAG: hypothetical protein RDV41_05600 [Planctomycetota bacterium]|nr:hypothetical protein [Planctomycetota bacterium]